MKLAAIPTGFWKTHYDLLLNDQPWGQGHVQGFKELQEIQLVDGRNLVLEKEHWYSSQFRLRNAKDQNTLAEGDGKGAFSRTWNLQLSVGSALFEPKGFFKSGYLANQGSHTLAEVNKCSNFGWGWLVESHDALNETDMLLIGLIYNTIWRRVAAAAVASY